MLQRVLAVVLSLAVVLCASPVALAAGVAGQISGVATLQSGEHLAGQVARLRSLDQGQIAAVTTTSGTGGFSFAGVNAGSYIVELVSNGSVVGTSAPLTLTSRNMIAANVLVTAAAAPAAAAAPPALFGGSSFWTSTFGMITMAAVAAGVTTAIVVTKDDPSASK
ncbi:MAG: hypothetical protein EHM55_14525 [Acidobacteria bacterium]|nr:MAG: hypothetical protein EHM55_14525 [Acidobacteriota bacterium]